MKILAIYGNPKHGGFVHDSIDHVAAHLEEKGVDVERLHLADADIRECIGCFHCLRTGTCPIEDDMSKIIKQMQEADGFITGASVRNSYFPALYKKFIERITYILGFGRELSGKHVLAIGAVGYASGKKNLKNMLTFSGFQTNVSGYLFFRTGIPSRLKVSDVKPRLGAGADKLYHQISNNASMPIWTQIGGAIDNFIVRRFMLKPNPDHVYDYIIKRWREKGLM